MMQTLAYPIVMITASLTVVLVGVRSDTSHWQQQASHVTVPGAVVGSQAAAFGLPGYKIVSWVPGGGVMPGGYYVIEADYKLPQADPKYNQTNQTCADLARKVTQEVSDLYKPRGHPPTSLPGGVPRAFYRWPGKITREEYDAVFEGFLQSLVPYKIWKGQLYRAPGNPKTNGYIPAASQTAGEQLILMALYLWEIPDVDFVIAYTDFPPPSGYPVIARNILRHQAKSGFTMPTDYHCSESLGPSQLEALHACYATRYPYEGRKPTIMFRGSPTGHFSINKETMHTKIPHRIKLNRLSLQNPLFDARLRERASWETDQEDPEIEAFIGPRAPRVEMEEYQKSAIVLDADGFGWSDRFFRLAHFDTPILKQASNWTGYFEHLVTPSPYPDFSGMVTMYAHDLNDLQDVGQKMMDVWQSSSRDKLVQQIHRLQGFALALLHEVAMFEAMAHTLLVYSQKIAWKVEWQPELNVTHIPFASACAQPFHGLNRGLNPEFCAQVKSKPGSSAGL